MMIAGFFQVQYNLSRILYSSPYYQAPPLVPVIISIVITITWAALGLIGATLGFRDRQAGYILMLVAGSGGLAGALIPISIYSVSPYSIGIIFLNATAMYIDPMLMLIGGILGFTLKPRPR